MALIEPRPTCPGAPPRATAICPRPDSVGGRTLTRAALVLGVATALGLGGCASARNPRLELRGPIAQVEPDALIELLAARRRAAPTLRGSSHIRVELEAADGTSRFGTNQAILLGPPGSFRFDALSPFGVSYAVASDGSAIAVFVPSEGRVYRGAASAQSIAAAAGVRASGREIVAALLGDPPVDPADLESAWTSRPGPQPRSGPRAADLWPEIVLHAASRAQPGETFAIGFARPGSGDEIVPVRFERYRRDGSVDLRALFDEFDEGGRRLLPRRIRVETGDGNAEIEYGEIELGAEIAPAAFRIATPRGMEEIGLPPPADGPGPAKIDRTEAER